jgi:glutamate dehydrogenase
MTMLGKVPASRLRLIEAIVRAAHGGVPGADRALTEEFVRRYFRGVANEDLVDRGATDLAAAALAHLRGALTRRAGQPSVRVFNPEPARDGFSSPHTVVMVVCDDMPFLVDSMSIAASQAGLAVHLIVHPVIEVQRDGRGHLRRILEAGSPGGRPESWQLLEVDRETDPARLAAFESRLRAVLDDVRVAVADWAEMRRGARVLAASLEALSLPLPPSEVVEARALLEWMEDNHFTFLGYRYYGLERGRSVDRLAPETRTGLGLLRPNRAGPPGRSGSPARSANTHASGSCCS